LQRDFETRTVDFHNTGFIHRRSWSVVSYPQASCG
jgi:hypothetical protein